MGFDDREIVALSGAHSLGRCHPANSGFEGKWVNNPTRFSNQYFRLLLSEDWREKIVAGTGLKQFVAVDEVTGDELMMLPTDLSLTSDPVFARWVKVYRDDQDLFFADFAKVFDKLMELGIKRDAEGKVINKENVEGGYVSAPKKQGKIASKL
ncbi:hypothetical protein MCOR31_011864 [Pyricularia oryzae]|nr:hypothetical protein MCOR31_011864 [Pyricularia oryzae]